VASIKIIPSAPAFAWRDWVKSRNPQDSRSSGRNLNPVPPEYEARVLTTRPRCSVQECNKWNILFHNKVNTSQLLRYPWIFRTSFFSLRSFNDVINSSDGDVYECLIPPHLLYLCTIEDGWMKRFTRKERRRHWSWSASEHKNTFLSAATHLRSRVPV
jgi:hypothetical protein